MTSFAREPSTKFGKAMSLHDFRRAAATFLAMDAPEKIGLIPGVLQHASPDVGEQHYNLSRIGPGQAALCGTSCRRRGTGCGRSHSRTRTDPMRAVIYARYSSDLQSATSIDDQIRLCRERVERENGTVVEIYADHAISGSSLRNRPRMQSAPRSGEERQVRLCHCRGSGSRQSRSGRYRRDLQATAALRHPASSLLLRARSANCMSASRAQ